MYEQIPYQIKVFLLTPVKPKLIQQFKKITKIKADRIVHQFTGFVQESNEKSPMFDERELLFDIYVDLIGPQNFSDET